MLLPHFFTITLYIGLFTALKMRDTIKEIMKMLLDKIKEGFMRVNVTEYPKPLSWDMESFSMLNIPRRTLGMKENLKTILEMVRNNVSPSQRLTIEGSAIKNEAILKLVEYLKEIILEERKNNPGFAPELEMLDDATDYSFDIQGWLEYSGSDIKFRKATVLRELGKTKEAVEFSEKWMKKEPENVVAATAGVYAFIDTKEYDKAEKQVDRFIMDKSKCFEENEIMFIAASKLYGAMGKEEEKEEIDKAIEKYDEYVEEFQKNTNEIYRKV